MSAPIPLSLQTNPRLSQWIRVRRDGHFDIFTGKTADRARMLQSFDAFAARRLERAA